MIFNTLRRKFQLIAATGIALMATPAQAVSQESHLSTQDIYTACGQLLRVADGLEFASGVCGGYVMGLLDVERIKTAAAQRYCIPENVTPRSVVSALHGKLGQMPEHFDEPAIAIIPVALAKTYPCPTLTSGR